VSDEASLSDRKLDQLHMTKQNHIKRVQITKETNYSSYWVIQLI